MDQAAAERWVTISAVLVAGVYAYRRLTEPGTPPPTLKKLLGIGGLPPLGSWATAWGFTYLVIALMTEASPGLGGSFAILVAATDFLTNSEAIFADLQKDPAIKAGAPSASTQAANVSSSLASEPQAAAQAKTGAAAANAAAGSAVKGLGF